MLKRVLVSLAAMFASLLLAELVVRIVGVEILGGDRRTIDNCRQYLSRGTLLYNPFPYIGYTTKARRAEDPTYPSRDWSFELEPGEDVVRIACLGGSTTYGGYPWELEKTLEESTGGSFQVMNWGCPGWTTQETMVNYFVTVQSYEPDIVILHHAVNDRRPRERVGYREDYAHWRSEWRGIDMGPLKRMGVLTSDIVAAMFVRGDTLKLYRFVTRSEEESLAMAVRAGLPTEPGAEAKAVEPSTARGFARNIRTVAEHVRLRGGKVVLATMPYNGELAAADEDKSWVAIVDEHNQVLRDIAAEEGYLLVDQALAVEEAGAEAIPHFVDRVHMNPTGKAWKASTLAEALRTAGFVP